MNITTPDTTICPNTPLTLNATIGSSAGNFLVFTDDIFSSVIPLGFSFTFYGNTYTSCVISSNGFVSFNLAYANQSSEWAINPLQGGPGGVPGNLNCLNSVMGPYHDVDPSEGGSIEYSTQGVAPNRRFVVTFCDVPMYDCNTLIARHQIVLFEGTNFAEVYIGAKPICAAWNAGAAIEGVQNATGTAAVTVPGRNFPGTWTTTNDGQRFTPSGTTYTVSSIPFQFYPTGLNNITWYEGSSTTSIGTGNNITVTPAANTFYRAVAQGCLGTSADTVNVSIGVGTTAPTVVSPVDYCQGATASPLSATGTNLLWYTTPTGGVGTPTAPTPSTAAVGTTTYYVSQNPGGNCEGPRAAIVVNVGTPPDTPAVTTPLTYCVGAAADTLTAAGQNLLWYTTPTGGVGNPSSPTPSTAAAGSTTYYVSQTVSGCESPRSAIVVNVLNNPVVTVSASTNNICVGGLSLLTANGAGVYSWSPSAGLSGVVGPTVLASPAVTTTYSVVGGVSVNATTVCYDTADITVTVTPNPSIVANANSPLCAGETITLTATAPAGATYDWTGPASFTSNLQNPTIAGASTLTEGTYTVTASVNGCDSSASVEVDVLPSYLTTTSVSICTGETYTFNGVTYSTSGTYADTFSTVAGCDSIKVLQLTVQPPVPAPTVTSPVERCQGSDPIALTATGQNLRWYLVPTGGGASSTPPAPPTTNVGTITYYVSQVINGCEGPRAPIQVGILYTPPPPVVAPPMFYCKGEAPMQLFASGNNITWYSGNSSTVGSPIAPTPSTAVPGTYNFYATQTEGFCESPRALVPVVVKPLPPARVLLDTLPVCAGDTAYISAFEQSGTDTAVFTWHFPPQAIIHTGGDGGPYAVTWTGAGNFPITLSVLQNGCTDSTTFVVPVTGPQSADFLVDSVACAGDVVEVNAGDIPGWLPGFGYQWNFDGGTIMSGAQGGPYTIEWTQPGIRYVSLQLTANGCPGAITTHPIRIGALPDVRIARPVDGEVCGGDTMTLRVENPSPLHTYSWNPKRFFDEVSEGSIVRGRIYNTGFVTVTATSPLGCEATDQVEIKARPCCELMIPNAFSPNNDGRNDRFRAISEGFHHDYELRVVNRYGQIMFLSKNQLEGWDGTRNGIPQDPGVYFYHIKYDCVDGSTQERTGDVMLIR